MCDVRVQIFALFLTSCLFAKAQRVKIKRKEPNECLRVTIYHKNSKTFPPWLQAPIKILNGKNRAKRLPDFCFSNEKRVSVHSFVATQNNDPRKYTTNQMLFCLIFIFRNIDLSAFLNQIEFLKLDNFCEVCFGIFIVNLWSHFCRFCSASVF